MPGTDRPSPLSGPVPLRHVIETHLDKILGSATFTTAEGLRRLLRFVVHEAIAGRGEAIKEYSLGVSVLGRGESFDPKADPIVRVQMLRLREHLARYYGGEGRHDTLIVEIPKGRYTPSFLAGAGGGAGVAVTVEDETLTVGHEAELLALRAAFDAAARGGGGMLSLTGEPGIGKTTVAEIFLRRLTASGTPCRVVTGRCAEQLIGSDAYLAILEALQELLRGDETARRVMQDGASSWYRQLAPLETTTTGTARQLASSERLKRELAGLLQSLAREQPLVLFLDDLHWADAATVDALAYLVPRCATHRVLVVGTNRDADLAAINPGFLAMKQELQAHGVYREIAMALLTAADVGRFLELQHAQHEFPPDLAERIHTRTGGNPLFVADLVRLLRERGVLGRRDGRWVLAGTLDDVDRDLPESVRSMVQRKIARLGEDDRKLMTAAAVLGHRFTSAVLARALPLDAEEVEERLAVLDEHSRFVRLAGERILPDGTLTLDYAFAHVLYQQALVAALTPARKAALSRSLANAQLALHGEEASDIASQLALLFETARDFARAADFSLRAAKNAARMFATDQSLAQAERAVSNARQLEGAQRHSRVLAAKLHVAAQLQSATRFDEAIEAFQEAEDAACALADPAAQVDAIFGAAKVALLARRIPAIRACGERALAIGHASGRPALIAAATAMLALEGLASGDVISAERRFDEAIPVLREPGLETQALPTVLARGLLRTWRLEHLGAEADLEWARAHARRAHAPFETLIGLWHTARSRGNQGRISEAAEMLDEAASLADLLGDRFWPPRIENTRGWLRAELLDVEDALRLDTNAVLIAREVGDFEAESHSHVNAARDCLALGDPAAAWPHLEHAQRGYRSNEWFRWVYDPRLQGELAAYWLAVDDLPRAAECARVSLEDATRTSSRKRIAWAHHLLGEVAARADRLDDAAREHGAALAVLDAHACPTIEWRILRAAAAAARLRREDEVRRSLIARARHVVAAIADSITDSHMSAAFLRSQPVRDL